jgi:hypothetical protein
VCEDGGKRRRPLCELAPAHHRMFRRPPLAPRKREERALGERSDVGSLGHGEVDPAVSPDAATMLSCVFF